MRNPRGFGKDAVPRREHIWLVINAVMLVALTACAQSEGSLRQENGDQAGMRSVHVRKVHDALAKNDVSAAEWAWHDAYVAGLRSGSWKSMIEVGDAALCIAEAAGFPHGSVDRARQSYEIAHVRARFQDSIEGLRRTAQAFAALGDREAVDQCTHIAKGLAGGATMIEVEMASVLDGIGGVIDHRGR